MRESDGSLAASGRAPTCGDSRDAARATRSGGQAVEAATQVVIGKLSIG
jgi:hypothetical protein